MGPVRPSTTRNIEGQVLDIVTAFVTELRHGRLEEVEIRPDSLLERDLGIYSLERLELILRLEHACGVDLDEEATIHASSVADVACLVSGQRLRVQEHEPDTRGRASRGAAIHTPHPGATRPGSLVFTAYVGLLLLPMGAVVWLLLQVLPSGPQAARLLQRGVRTLFRAAGCRIEVEGRHNLDNALPAVLVANHQSYLDSLVLLAALPVLPNIIVNERLPGAPLVGTAVRAARFLAVDRTSIAGRLRCADAMVAALSAGESLLVFPEATFDAGPVLLPFRLGAFSAAVTTGRPIVPVTLRGTRQMLPSDARLLRRSALSVTVHPPIYPHGRSWEEALRLRAESREHIARATQPDE
jgi:1-acyl-sn-glycerol-3-phosphate acyltransferase